LSLLLSEPRKLELELVSTDARSRRWIT
jgi:hypothetical protein